MFQLLMPAGLVALSERALILHALLLMMIVVVPLFILAIVIAWRYRASNTKAAYTPDWEHSPMEELIWWVIPLEIILVLGALTWTSTHQLDPYKPLDSQVKPLPVEVIALNWKWLFIYPTLGVATVNELDIPVNTPVTFAITSDAPMNSFFIPRLGGQIYAMTGMSTETHLEATETGTFMGMSANYSGDGFAGMQFKTNALSQSDFNAWLVEAKHSPLILTQSSYTMLASPSQNAPVTIYGNVAKGLYNSIINKFMTSASTTPSNNDDMAGMSM